MPACVSTPMNLLDAKITGLIVNILINGVRMKKLTSKHNVLQEEDGGLGKCMINRSLRVVMN